MSCVHQLNLISLPEGPGALFHAGPDCGELCHASGFKGLYAWVSSFIRVH